MSICGFLHNVAVNSGMVAFCCFIIGFLCVRISREEVHNMKTIKDIKPRHIIKFIYVMTAIPTVFSIAIYGFIHCQAEFLF